MKLTDEQLKELIEKLNFSDDCPNCRATNKYVIDPTIYSLISVNHTGGSLNISGQLRLLEQTAVVCEACGFTRLFSLRALGIIK